MLDEKKILSKLEVGDLNEILKSISLGKDKIPTLFTPRQIRDLLREVSTQKKQKNTIKSDKQEQLGKTTLIVNTIISGCLGGWLGLSAYGHINLNNILTIVIVSGSFLLGILFAALSAHNVNQQAQESLVRYEILEVELAFLVLITKKLDINFVKLENQINKIISLLTKKNHLKDEFKSLKSLLLNKVCLDLIFKNLTDRIKAIKDKNSVYQNYYERSITSIKKNYLKLQDHYKFYSNENTIHRKLGGLFQKSGCINKLINLDLKNPKIVPPISQWIKNNRLNMLNNLMPTILGGFASLFVFMNGIPLIFSHYEVKFNIVGLSITHLKILGLITSVCLTAYYGYAQVYTDYKNFCRKRQLEIARNNLDENYIKVVRQFNLIGLLTRLKYILKRLKSIEDSLKMIEE